jgi:UDPglucose 6-dehydrogenase
LKISIAGTGYVGLVTGVCLADTGYQVTCFDIDEQKIQRMKGGLSPIYEPGLDELMKKNIEAGRLTFTSSPEEAYRNKDIIYIAVGTPENKDGSANLQYVEAVAGAIAEHVNKDVVVVTKSTVPVGTNDYIKSILEQKKSPGIKIDIVSNPEFLREGSAIHDTFHGDRIVIGTEDEQAGEKMRRLYEPFGLPIVMTNIRSAEMIKYAANAFLATKISFINEIANICERVGADISDVAGGIGMDKRIGREFLHAGIGYGGSCFPKDTKALAQLADQIDYRFNLLESVIEVNNQQRTILFEKATRILGTFAGKKAAVLGLAFKPNTDDIREAASLLLIDKLLEAGASVRAYDPIAAEHVKKEYGQRLEYAGSPADALSEADVAFIVTEWDDIKSLPLSVYVEQMKTPVILDGRNCYNPEEAKTYPLTYISIGREEIHGLK